MLKRRLVTLAVLLVAGGTALLAVPDLRRAVDDASSINVLWVIAAVALELASCMSFLAIFRRFFEELPASEARRLAWIEMGSGALLPGGGVGSLAAGGMLLRRGGMPTQSIVRRSSGLFFLTSGTNVLALEGAAGALALGLGSGSHRAVLAAAPAAAGVVGVAIALALPHGRWHRGGHNRALDAVVDGIRHAQHELIRPHWRLLGALGYLGFDIAVLGLTCAGAGHPLGVPALVLAYIIGYAANALPVPGGIGVLEGGLVGALVLYGIPVMPATAGVLLYHTIAFWIPSLGGAAAYGLSMTGRRSALRSGSVHVLERAFRYRARTWPDPANSIPRTSSTGRCTPSGSGATARRRSTIS